MFACVFPKWHVCVRPVSSLYTGYCELSAPFVMLNSGIANNYKRCESTAVHADSISSKQRLVIHVQRRGFHVQQARRRALHYCPLVLRTGSWLTNFSAVQQPLLGTRSVENHSCFVSQKPESDSHQNATASHLHNIQQLMLRQV